MRYVHCNMCMQIVEVITEQEYWIFVLGNDSWEQYLSWYIRQIRFKRISITHILSAPTRAIPRTHYRYKYSPLLHTTLYSTRLHWPLPWPRSYPLSYTILSYSTPFTLTLATSPILSYPIPHYTLPPIPSPPTWPSPSLQEFYSMSEHLATRLEQEIKDYDSAALCFMCSANGTYAHTPHHTTPHKWCIPIDYSDCLLFNNNK